MLPVEVTAAPPAGVECDCENPADCGHDQEHWHLRAMGAVCDLCKDQELHGDFLAYTTAGAFEAIAQYARDLGWFVLKDTNFYYCYSCRLQ